MLADADVDVLLLDIEGTTTSVAFVFEVLFPFARRALPDFLARRRGDPPVEEDLALLRDERAAEREADAPPVDPDPAAYLHWLMDRDRKSTALKSLQGRIWEEGYRAGLLEGEVYPDVPPAFERWTKKGKKIAIYSSGSVRAQKLLFSHTREGDLTPYIHDHFDTTTGPKKEARSYRLIAERLALAPDRIVFLSDSRAELDAARVAGMRTALAVRAAGPLPASAHPVFRSFDEILP